MSETKYAVHTPTQASYDVLMRAYEAKGWKWNDEPEDSEHTVWVSNSENTCIDFEDKFGFAYKGHHTRQGDTILTLREALIKLGHPLGKRVRDEDGDEGILAAVFVAKENYVPHLVQTVKKGFSLSEIKDFSQEAFKVQSSDEQMKLAWCRESYTLIEEEEELTPRKAFDAKQKRMAENRVEVYDESLPLTATEVNMMNESKLKWTTVDECREVTEEDMARWAKVEAFEEKRWAKYPMMRHAIHIQPGSFTIEAEAKALIDAPWRGATEIMTREIDRRMREMSIDQTIVWQKALNKRFNKPKPTFMENIVKRVQNLHLSKTDRILRKHGFEDENGESTEQARSMIIAEMIDTQWDVRRELIAADLEKLDKEEK